MKVCVGGLVIDKGNKGREIFNSCLRGERFNLNSIPLTVSL